MRCIEVDLSVLSVVVRLCGGRPVSDDDVVVDWSESSGGIHAINGV